MGWPFGIRKKPSTRETSRNPQDSALFLNLSGPLLKWGGLLSDLWMLRQSGKSGMW